MYPFFQIQTLEFNLKYKLKVRVIIVYFENTSLPWSNRKTSYIAEKLQRPSFKKTLSKKTPSNDIASNGLLKTVLM